MVVEETADVLRHVIVDAPRLGDQHHHDMRQPTACLRQQFRHVVEAGGIVLRFIDQRQ